MEKSEKQVHGNQGLFEQYSYDMIGGMEEGEYDFYAKMAADLCEVKTALICLQDGEQQWYLACYGMDKHKLPPKIPIHADSLADQKDAFILEDARQEASLKDSGLRNGYKELGFYAEIPLLTDVNKKLGNLLLTHAIPKSLNKDQLTCLKMIARQIVGLLELRKKSKENHLLNDKLSHLISLFNESQSVSKVGAWEINLTDNTTIWTETVYHIFEVPVSFDPKQEDIADFYHPEDRHIMDEALNLAVSKGQSFDVNFRLIADSGNTKWIRARGKTLFDEVKPYKLIGSFQDITQQRQNEENLEMERSRIASILSGTNVGTWEWNVQTGETIFNARWAEIAGYTLKELEPVDIHTWHRLSHPDDQQTSEQLLENCFRGKSEYYDIETRIHHKDGHWVWVHDRGKVFSWTEDGKPLMMFGTRQDITQRKLTESELVLINSAINTTEDAIFMFDPIELKFFYVNEGAVRQLGYSESELLQMTPIDIKSKFTESGFREMIKPLLNEEQSSLSFETVHQRKDKHEVPVEIILQYTKGSEGEKYFIALVRDISARKASEKELKRITTAINTIEDGIFMFDADSLKFFYVNRGAIQQTGYSEEELLQMTPIDIKSKFTEESFRKMIAPLLREDNSSFSFETLHMRKSGYEIPVEIILQHIKGSQGERYFVALVRDISARKRSERVLKRITSAINTTQDTIFMFTPDSLQFFYTNNGARLQTGYSESELLQMTPVDIKSRLTEATFREMIAPLIKGDQSSLTFETFHRRKDGYEVPVEIILQFIEADNHEKYFVALVRDITMRKQTEKELKREQKFKHALLEAVDDGVVACDENGNLVLFNRAAREWHGMDALAVPRERWADYYDLFEGDARTPLKTEDIPLVKAFLGEYVQDEEMSIIAKGTKPRYLLANGAPFYDTDGSKLGAVVTMRDITERKKADEALRQSEQAFRGSFENTAVGMALLNKDGKWLKVNKTVCDIIGYTEDEMYKLTFQDITHPEDLHADLDLLQEVIEGSRDNYRMEKRYFHKKGHVIYIILTVSVVRDQQGEVLYFISQILDITGIKHKEQKISELLRVTEDQNDRLKNFAHIVSHNLRSHASGILGLLEIFKEEKPELYEEEVMNLLVKASKNLKETIDNLTEIVKINLLGSEEMQVIPLRESVLKNLSSITSLAKKSEVRLVEEVDAQVRVRALPAYLDSIIVNFLTNGIKYRSKDRKSFVKISSYIQEDFVVLSFEDNGLGIDLQKHGNRLFGLYKTFHEHKEARGIGLFITKNQVEAMGGKIEVESEVDKGTLFKIFLHYEKI